MSDEISNLPSYLVVLYDIRVKCLFSANYHEPLYVFPVIEAIRAQEIAERKAEVTRPIITPLGRSIGGWEDERDRLIGYYGAPAFRAAYPSDTAFAAAVNEALEFGRAFEWATPADADIPLRAVTPRKGMAPSAAVVGERPVISAQSSDPNPRLLSLLEKMEARINELEATIARQEAEMVQPASVPEDVFPSDTPEDSGNLEEEERDEPPKRRGRPSKKKAEEPATLLD